MKSNMLKTVLNRLIDEIEKEIKIVETKEINDETVEIWIFLRNQKKYINNVIERLEEEKTENE